jgi:CRISPR/Cas system CSM-associated protein Csm3 (group 7 of RAMP superfamily)
MNTITEYSNIHKIELHGKLELLTPLHIGSGSSENSDLDILLDANGKPYIPGTSIAGVIRHYMKALDDKFDLFFGKERKESDDTEKGQQSNIVFYDSHLITEAQKNETFKPKIRDGIRLSEKTAIVEDGAKYDYEILDPGVTFEFKIVLKYSDEEKENAKSFLKTIENLLSNEKLQFGANSNNGFGKVKLIQPEYKIYEVDSVESVWNRIFQTSKQNKLEAKQIEIIPNEFSIYLIANLESSLIIGDTDPDSESDKTHIKSNGKPVLTGSTLKGVIRSRLIQILNTISKEKNDKYLKLKYGLLGYVKEEFEDFEFKEIQKIFDKKNQKISAIQGRLIVQEKNIENTQTQLQPRIKIDRFTGGTIESALFDSMPVFTDAKSPSEIKIQFSINSKQFDEWKEAAGLLLLVLKDFWTGMLAIGGEKNIGRGRLIGKEAIITWKEDNTKREVSLKNENGKPKPSSVEGWQKLNQFVIQLNQYLGDKHGN